MTQARYPGGMMTDKPDIVERLREIGKFSLGWTADQAADEILALRAQRDQARDALVEFGQHPDWCKVWKGDDAPCTCGFSAALAKMDTPEMPDGEH